MLLSLPRVLMHSALCAALLISGSAVSQTLSFTENFEQGRLVNRDGVTWLSRAGKVAVSNAWAYSGSYSLLFPYTALPDTEDDFQEQPFALSTPVSDFWIKFKIRIPDGYYHRQVPSSANNKFLKISSNPERSSSEGVNLMWEYWPDGKGGSKLAYHWTNPNVEVSPHHDEVYVFGPAEAGKVLEFVLRARMSSARGVADGIVQTWVRKDGEASFKQLHNRTNAPLYPASTWSSQTRWVSGYILGWANASFAKDTPFYIDDLQISSASLMAPQPNPPAALSVR